MMKKQSILALIALSILLASCSNGVVGFKPEGEADGLPFSASNLNLGTMTFGKGPFYSDANGVSFPVNEDGLLTAPKNGQGYYAPTNPAILFANGTVNAGLGSVKSYNVGGFDYEATFRITDSTNAKVVGTTQYNEPQGVVLTAIWLDANKNPTGSLMAMCFIDNAFPCAETDPGGIGDKDPELEENVILVMNYHDKKIAHVISASEVKSLKPKDPAGRITGNNINDGFHTARLRVYPDADYSNADKTKQHGPSISVWIDNVEIIHYKNIGTTHSLVKGAWDTAGSVTGQSGITLARDVLKIPDDSHIAYFNAGQGAAQYNNAWKNLVCVAGDPKAMGSLLTFGVAVQIGKWTQDNNWPFYGEQRSPQVKNISIKSYPAL